MRRRFRSQDRWAIIAYIRALQLSQQKRRRRRRSSGVASRIAGHAGKPEGTSDDARPTHPPASVEALSADAR